jgi:hypothetical protein
MNHVYVLTRNGEEEMYFAPSQMEGVDRDLENFQKNGWKIKNTQALSDESFLKLKFRYLYDKHVIYLEMHRAGEPLTVEGRSSDMTMADIVFDTALALVKLANLCIDNDFDVEIPELVHQYINIFFFKDIDSFKESVLS